MGQKLPIILPGQGDKWLCTVDGIMFAETVTWPEDKADSFEII
jgi:hypothetical protein